MFKQKKYNSDSNVIINDMEIICKGDISNGVVMHKSEKVLMLKLAEIVTQNGGDILEIGFGMHLSADGIQSNPNVTSHTIIEIHSEIYKTALEWSKDKPNTNIILGDWIDIIPTIDKKFDGILYDGYMDTNLKKFLNYVKPNCKKGTIIGFFEFDGDINVINGVRVSLPINEFEQLPYKNITAWKTNSFELKYTIFNGEKFVKEFNITKLI